MTDGPEALLASRNVSRETLDRLERFAALLRKWNPAINLVSPKTLDELWVRHILDSAQVFDLVSAGTGHWADLGSGGGFPGLVVAILAKDEAPELTVTLVESDARKATFLQTAARELGLGAAVVVGRIEEVSPLNADVISARALAPLGKLLGFAARHLSPAGTALFPKGENHDAELAEALETWRFSVQKVNSKTDPRAVVLKIGEISRV